MLKVRLFAARSIQKVRHELCTIPDGSLYLDKSHLVREYEKEKYQAADEHCDNQGTYPRLD